MSSADDDRISRLLADLEAEARGREEHEKLGEFGDLVIGETAESTLAERISGAHGAVAVVFAAGAALRGRVTAAAEEWCAIDGGEGEVIVRLAAIDEIRLPGRRRAAPQSRLSFASPLRAALADGRSCTATTVTDAGDVDVRSLDGARVAADHVEIPAEGTSVLIPTARIAFVRVRR